LLVDELRAQLSLPAAVPIIEALGGIPVERLVRAFFEAAAPFVDMWQDLLALFERAAASIGSQQLDIEYDFSSERPDKLRFNLEHFRREILRVRQLMARFDLSRADQSDLWDLQRAYAAGARRDEIAVPANPAVAGFDRAYHDGPFPAQLPPRPVSGDPRLDGLVEETWALGQLVHADLRAVFGDYRTVRVAGWEARPVPSGLPYETLRLTGSDLWLVSLVETATAALAGAGPATVAGRRKMSSPGALADAIDAALQRLRNQDTARTTPQEQLEELLSLPLWKHRYRGCLRRCRASATWPPALGTSVGKDLGDEPQGGRGGKDSTPRGGQGSEQRRRLQHRRKDTDQGQPGLEHQRHSTPVEVGPVVASRPGLPDGPRAALPAELGAGDHSPILFGLDPAPGGRGRIEADQECGGLVHDLLPQRRQPAGGEVDLTRRWAQLGQQPVQLQLGATADGRHRRARERRPSPGGEQRTQAAVDLRQRQL
jgi:hypothetical protein